MMSKTRAFKVSIFNDTYSLISDEPEERVYAAVAMVDTLMKELADKAGSVDSKRIAVLACLKTASQLLEQRALHQDAFQRLIEQVDHELIASAHK